MRLFLRQTTVGREPLAVAMSGVRMGERVLQIGMDDPRVAALLAAKPGLSGQSAMTIADDATAEQAREAIAETGALVDIQVGSSESLPFETGTFDLVVVHNRTAPPTAPAVRTFRECLRVLRSGGRVVVLDKGTPSGFAALFHARKPEPHAETVIRDLEDAGFHAVRTLGDRDGYCFIEGMKIARID